MAGSDGMAGWATSSAEEGGRTGLGEAEREDGADMVTMVRRLAIGDGWAKAEGVEMVAGRAGGQRWRG